MSIFIRIVKLLKSGSLNILRRISYPLSICLSFLLKINVLLDKNGIETTTENLFH